MAADPVNIEIVPIPNGLLIRIADVRVTQAHGEQIMAAIASSGNESGADLVLNLQKVDSFQSAGLATLARIAFEHRLKIVGTDEKITRLLDLMGILPVVDLGDSEEEFLPSGDTPAS
jgi:anti-anti-sigma factor